MSELPSGKPDLTRIVALIVGVVGTLCISKFFNGQPTASNLTRVGSDIQWVETGSQTVGEKWCLGGGALIL
jgi:drug/metabolite transporter (DMT)-like permease